MRASSCSLLHGCYRVFFSCVDNHVCPECPGMLQLLIVAINDADHQAHRLGILHRE